MLHVCAAHVCIYIYTYYVHIYIYRHWSWIILAGIIPNQQVFSRACRRVAGDIDADLFLVLPQGPGPNSNWFSVRCVKS